MNLLMRTEKKTKEEEEACPEKNEIFLKREKEAASKTEEKVHLWKEDEGLLVKKES